MTKAAKNFEGLADPRKIIIDGSGLIKPKTKLTPTECAASYMHVGAVGGYQGLWLPDKTPYMKQPLNDLANPAHNAIVFMSGAQNGKTEGLIIASMVYAVLGQASDFMIVGPDRDFVTDLAKRRVGRTIEDSPELSRLLMRTMSENTISTKMFKNGPMINLVYATASKLAGKAVPIVALTEIDRMRINVGGQGGAFDMARKRTTTFGRKAKVIAESTPGFNVKETGFELPNPHHCPPADGVASLYMQGDRKRWYWTCPDCDKLMLVEWACIWWDREIKDPQEASETVKYICKNCGSMLPPSAKHSMNQKGVWLSEYDVYKTGPKHSRISSYWTEGPSAGMMTWKEMVAKYLLAEATYDRTGSQEELKVFYNLDVGAPYIPKDNNKLRDIKTELQERAQACDYERGIVQPWVIRITTTVDIQKNRFVVLVMGYGENYEGHVIDRFNISRSNRVSDSGSYLNVQPFTYAEDWDVLDRLFTDRYKISGTEDELQSDLILMDTGGQDETTENAYRYGLTQVRRGNRGRVALLKGNGKSLTSRLSPMKNDVDRLNIPRYTFASNLLKDELFHALSRPEPGPSYIHFPAWLPSYAYDELMSEQRQPDGKYTKKYGVRNEMIDLMVMSRVGLSLMKYDSVNWESPESISKYSKKKFSEKKKEEPSELKTNLQQVKTEVKSNSREDVLKRLSKLGSRH